MRLVKGARVRIIGDHPHRGEAGTVDGFNGQVGMWKVKVDPNQGVGGDCYAAATELRALPREEDPYS